MKLKNPALYLTLALTLVSCSESQVAETAHRPSIVVDKIAIMPIGIAPGDSNLAKGASVLTTAITAQLAGKKNINIIDEDQAESYLGDFSGSSHEAVRFIGRQTGSDSVLSADINRFHQRDGKTYSATTPASVAFQYQLIHVESGKTLCSGIFDETQQPLSANLFSFTKASARGFRWLTAEELLADGLAAELDQCIFLTD